MNNLEQLLFKSYNHCKRGQGIQHIPKHVNNEDFDYKKFLYNAISFSYSLLYVKLFYLFKDTYQMEVVFLFLLF